MERLPYIDEHSITIEATPERTWELLVGMLGRLGSSVPRPMNRTLGLQPPTRSGSWRGDAQPGDSIPGFGITESEPPKRLELRRGHRFSSYALIFQLEPGKQGKTKLSAQTWAAFPGVTGKLYRAMVIGSRGHRVAVWHMLRQVATRD
jgi:hypothetical protein